MHPCSVSPSRTTGGAPRLAEYVTHLCESIDDIGYESVEVNDSGLDSNYRGRGAFVGMSVLRDLQIVE